MTELAKVDEVRGRVRAWMAANGWSQEGLATELGVTQGAIAKMLGGGGVSLRVAHAIETRSAAWDLGPIRTEEWVSDIEATERVA